MSLRGTSLMVGIRVVVGRVGHGWACRCGAYELYEYYGDAAGGSATVSSRGLLDKN